MSGFGIRAPGGRGIASNYSVFSVQNCRFLYSSATYVHFSGGFGDLHDNLFLEQGTTPDWENGILIDNNGSVSLRRNVFYGLRYLRTFSTTANQVKIINNTFVNCSGGINVAGAKPVPGVVYNNIFFNIPGTALSSNTSGPVVDFNLYYQNGANTSGVAPGSHSLFTDPLLADVGALDFSLLPLSPCIDAGNPDPVYDDPDGTRNDIGAVYARGRLLPLATALNLGWDVWLHVVSHTPTFHWTYYDTLVSMQAGFQAQVGLDNDWSAAEMWDSGEISSADSSVTYAGLPLEDGAVYYCRVRVSNGSTWGDWSLSQLHMNTIPTAPTPNSPPNGALVFYTMADLVVANATDADGDTLTYRFEVYADSTLTTFVAFQTGVPEKPLLTSSGRKVGLSPDTKYWWRARVGDGFESSIWSDTGTFVTRGVPAIIRVPSQFPSIQAGINVAVARDTVLVAAGRWSENLAVAGKPLTLLSEEGPVKGGVKVYQVAVQKCTTLGSKIAL